MQRQHGEGFHHRLHGWHHLGHGRQCAMAVDVQRGGWHRCPEERRRERLPVLTALHLPAHRQGTVHCETSKVPGHYGLRLQHGGGRRDVQDVLHPNQHALGWDCHGLGDCLRRLQSPHGRGEHNRGGTRVHRPCSRWWPGLRDHGGCSGWGGCGLPHRHHPLPCGGLCSSPCVLCCGNFWRMGHLEVPWHAHESANGAAPVPNASAGWTRPGPHGPAYAGDHPGDRRLGSPAPLRVPAANEAPLRPAELQRNTRAAGTHPPCADDPPQLPDQVLCAAGHGGLRGGGWSGEGPGPRGRVP
mmetsp:Transcript_131039/g.226829  ORF Transcript_131039/g.226829 Transcript_131039/m.226829 type:complete len:299 (-) Transcript_131039:733-1629(-)